MLTKGVKKYIANPLLGILPFILFIVLHTYIVSEPYAIITSLTSVLAAQFILAKHFKSRVQGVTFYITAAALMITGGLWIIGNKWIEMEYTYILVAEIAIIVQLMILRIGKTFMKANLFKQKTFMEKALINDFFYTTTILQYALTAHVFILLAYKQVTSGYINDIADHILYIIIPITIIVGLCIYQFFRTSHMIKKLRQEEWLPIVTESGEVTGRIAKAVSVNMKNKYMHPVVRIALICNGRIYLQEREDRAVLDPGKIDHPFEKYMLFKHEVNIAAHNSIKRILGRDIENEPSFVFKYVFENESTKRLIFLFTIEVDSELQVTRTGKMIGKFWSVKQIDEEFGNEIFSECFELEYEYLKHVILLDDADNLIALSKEEL